MIREQEYNLRIEEPFGKGGGQEMLPLSTIELLAQAYRSRETIHTGIDRDAAMNNRAVISVLQNVGRTLEEDQGFQDKLFGIFLGGSRVIGYNMFDSDIDIALVLSDKASSNDRSSILNLIDTQLTNAQIYNPVETVIEGFTLPTKPIPTTPDDFDSLYNDATEEANGLFGNMIYANNNFYLARLTFLEMINRDFRKEIVWKEIKDIYNQSFLFDLGDTPDMQDEKFQKIAERYGTTLEYTKRLLLPAIAARYKKFGLSDFQATLKRNRNWYKKERNTLKGYSMEEVHIAILEKLKAEEDNY